MKAFQNIITNVVNAFAANGKTQFFPVVQQITQPNGNLKIELTLFSEFNPQFQTARPESGYSNKCAIVTFYSCSYTANPEVLFELKNNGSFKSENLKQRVTLATDSAELLAKIGEMQELMAIYSELQNAQIEAVKNKAAKAEQEIAKGCVKLNETEAKKFMTDAVKKLKSMCSPKDKSYTQHRCEFKLIEIKSNGEVRSYSIRITQGKKTSYSCHLSRITKDEIAELFSKCWIALGKETYETH